MNCPKCKHDKTKVYNSRPFENTIRRNRECLKCKHRYATVEILETEREPRITAPPVKKPTVKKTPKVKSGFRNPKPDLDRMTDEELEAFIFADNFSVDEDEL